MFVCEMGWKVMVESVEYANEVRVVVGFWSMVLFDMEFSIAQMAFLAYFLASFGLTAEK